LQVTWTYPFGDTGSGPIVVRGVIYGHGRNGSLIALDAATGKERWVRESIRNGGASVLLVPAASTPPQRTAAATAGPLGWVAYALPFK
jgi:outer membrane protein assembly factor BamB